MFSGSLGKRKLNSKAKRPDYFDSFDELKGFLKQYFKQDHWSIKNNLPYLRIEVIFDYLKGGLGSNDQQIVFILTAEELHSLTKISIRAKVTQKVAELSKVFRFEL